MNKISDDPSVRTTMATATTFIALQCFQCSTMQVKQQKRSSNKWTCVVCNEKQSVLKVFARSHMAKDIRSFVQSFNMSRRFSDSLVPAMAPPQSETERSDSVDAESSGGAAGRKTKRMDWTEYLDAEGCGTELEDEKETITIVTELPEGLFKKAKLNTGASKSGFPKGSNSILYKPQFSNRSNAQSVLPSVQRSEKVRSDSSLQHSTGKRYRSETEDDVGLREVQMTGTERESRWSSYMTQEDDVFRSRACGDTRSNFVNETSRFGGDLLETATHDQAVEDDVHPDFI